MANLVTLTITLLACARARGALRMLFALAALASAGCVVLAGTRSLWPALVLVPLVCGLFYRRHIDKRQLLASGALFAAAAVLFGVFATAVVQKRVELLIEDYRSFVADQDLSGSLGQRVTIWKAGWQLVKEAPLIGHGPAQGKQLLAERTGMSYTHFHNAFLNFAVRDGIFGGIVVALMLAGPLVLAWRSRRDEIGDYGLAMSAGVTTSHLFSGLFNNMIGQDLLDSLFIVSMTTGMFLVFGNGRDHSQPPSS
jgi:O-antigen ligase